MPYDTPILDEGKEEAYWNGDELRKKTSVLEDSLLDNLPYIFSIYRQYKYTHSSLRLKSIKSILK
jgi:hypothetical protein